MRSSNGIGELLVGDVLDGVMQHYCRSAPMDAIAQIELVSHRMSLAVHRALVQHRRIDLRASTPPSYPKLYGDRQQPKIEVNNAALATIDQCCDCLRYILDRMHIVSRLSLNIAYLNVNIMPVLRVLLDTGHLRLCVLRVSYTYHGDESPLVAALIRKHCSTLRIIDKIAMDVAVDAITCELNARKLVLLDFDTTNHETMMPTLRARIIDSLANSGASIDKLVYWTEHGMAPSEIPFTRLLNNTRVSTFQLSTLDSSSLNMYIPAGSESSQLCHIKSLEIYSGRNFYFNAVDIQFAFPNLRRFQFKCDSIDISHLSSAVQLAMQWTIAFPFLEGYACCYIRSKYAHIYADTVREYIDQLIKVGGRVQFNDVDKLVGGQHFLSCIIVSSKCGFHFRIYCRHPKIYYDDVYSTFEQ